MDLCVMYGLVTLHSAFEQIVAFINVLNRRLQLETFVFILRLVVRLLDDLRQ